MNVVEGQWRKMAADAQAFERRWTALIRDSHTLQALQGLSHLTRSLDAQTGARPVRHTSTEWVAAEAELGAEGHRGGVSFSWRDLSRGVGSGAGLQWHRRQHAPAACCCCIDQLFLQAAVVQPLFLDKVQAWAAQTGGYFPAKLEPQGAAAHVAGGQAQLADNDAARGRACRGVAKEGAGEGRAWEEAVRDDSLREGIAEAEMPLKAAEAVAKVVLKLDCDASRCVDMVEQLVIFDSVQAQVRPAPPPAPAPCPVSAPPRICLRVRPSSSIIQYLETLFGNRIWFSRDASARKIGSHWEGKGGGSFIFIRSC